MVQFPSSLMSPGPLAVLVLLLSVAVAALIVGIAFGRRRNLRQTQMLEAVGEAIISIDLQGCVTFWNTAAERLYGWRAAEAMGRPIFELTSTTDARRDVGRARTHVLLAKGEMTSGRYLVQRRDGTDVHVLATTTPILDRRGRRLGYVGMIRDIAEVVAAEEEQRRMQHQLQQSARMTSLGRLAAGMAHEFNNVLMAIQPLPISCAAAATIPRSTVPSSRSPSPCSAAAA